MQAILLIAAAAAGATITAFATLGRDYLQRRNDTADLRLTRAAEVHRPHYEDIFMAARALEKSLQDYHRISSAARTRSDPILQQMVKLVGESAAQFGVAADWQHNESVLHLPLALEDSCVEVHRDVQGWLRSKKSATNVALSMRVGIDWVDSDQLETALQEAAYSELRVEKIHVVPRDDAEARNILHKLEHQLQSLTGDLRNVISY